MKRNVTAILSTLLFITLLVSACKETAKEKSDNKKVDSLESKTQHAMDSAEDAILKKIDAMSDDDIVNDTLAPEKPVQE